METKDILRNDVTHNKKSPEHEDWISSPSFCSQRGGRGISPIFFFSIPAILARRAYPVENFPYFVGGLYVREEMKHEDKDGVVKNGHRKKHVRVWKELERDVGLPRRVRESS